MGRERIQQRLMPAETDELCRNNGRLLHGEMQRVLPKRKILPVVMFKKVTLRKNFDYIQRNKQMNGKLSYR